MAATTVLNLALHQLTLAIVRFAGVRLASPLVYTAVLAYWLGQAVTAITVDALMVILRRAFLMMLRICVLVGR